MATFDLLWRNLNHFWGARRWFCRFHTGLNKQDLTKNVFWAERCTRLGNCHDALQEYPWVLPALTSVVVANCFDGTTAYCAATFPQTWWFSCLKQYPSQPRTDYFSSHCGKLIQESLTPIAANVKNRRFFGENNITAADSKARRPNSAAHGQEHRTEESRPGFWFLVTVIVLQNFG